MKTVNGLLKVSVEGSAEGPVEGSAECPVEGTNHHLLQLTDTLHSQK
jgi:hypothetical protein